MTLKEIKDAVLAGKRVCWSGKNYEVILDSVGQWLIRCVDNGYCIGLTWRDGVTMNGKPKEFFVDVKPVSEIPRDAASALRGYGHDRVTTPPVLGQRVRREFPEGRLPRGVPRLRREQGRPTGLAVMRGSGTVG